MDEPWTRYSECSKADKKKTSRFHLYEIPRIEWWLPGPGEKANGNYCLMYTILSFSWEDEKALEMDGGNEDGWQWMMMNDECT